MFYLSLALNLPWVFKLTINFSSTECEKRYLKKTMVRAIQIIGETPGGPRPGGGGEVAEVSHELLFF